MHFAGNSTRSFKKHQATWSRSTVFEWGGVDGFIKLPDDVEGSGRQSAPMGALRDAEAAEEGNEQEATRARFRDVVMENRMQSLMPPAQSVFLLRRLAKWDDSPEVARALEFARVSLQLVDATERGALEGVDGIAELEGMLILGSAEGRCNGSTERAFVRCDDATMAGRNTRASGRPIEYRTL